MIQVEGVPKIHSQKIREVNPKEKTSIACCIEEVTSFLDQTHCSCQSHLVHAFVTSSALYFHIQVIKCQLVLSNLVSCRILGVAERFYNHVSCPGRCFDRLGVDHEWTRRETCIIRLEIIINYLFSLFELTFFSQFLNSNSAKLRQV